MASDSARRGEYGYDAPSALIGFAIAGIVAAAGAVVVWRNTGAVATPPPVIAVLIWLNATIIADNAELVVVPCPLHEEREQ